MKKWIYQKSGISLVELSLAIAIFAIIATGVAIPIIGNHISALENQKSLQANAVLTESWEAVRAIRNHNWSDFVNGTYGLRKSNGYWEFYGGSDQLHSGFTRMVTLTNIFRDASGNLVETGGMFDSDSKRIRIQISWEPISGQSRSIEAESLVSNYINPSVWPPA